MGKKIFTILLLIAIVAWGSFYFFIKNGNESNETIQSGPLNIEHSSDVFTAGVQDMMANYFSMADAFVQEDSGKVNAAAVQLQASLQALPTKQLKADTTIISLVNNLNSQLQSDISQITAQSNWDEKRRSLQMASDLLFDMLRTVQYNGGKVYQQFCPMAFDNTGANWLSAHPEIRNPYFGDKMLECGEVKDSINFMQ